MCGWFLLLLLFFCRLSCVCAMLLVVFSRVFSRHTWSASSFLLCDCNGLRNTPFSYTVIAQADTRVTHLFCVYPQNKARSIILCGTATNSSNNTIISMIFIAIHCYSLIFVLFHSYLVIDYIVRDYLIFSSSIRLLVLFVSLRRNRGRASARLWERMILFACCFESCCNLLNVYLGLTFYW